MAETFLPSTTTDNPASGRPSIVSLIVIALLSAVLLLVPVKVTALTILALFCLSVAAYLLFSVLQGNFSPILLTWAAIFPLGYYFLSFPREKPWFTFDRAMVGLLLLGLIATAWSKSVPIARTIRAAGVAWSLFLLAAVVSIAGGQDTLSATHALVDAFLLPALLGLYILRVFPAGKYLKQIHILVALMSIYLAAIGIAEVYSGVDLLPLPGAGDYFAGSPGLQLLRVNGPFLSNTSYGLIGLTSFFLLRFFKKAAESPLPFWLRCLHAAGLASALAVALMPLFRSIALTLLFVFAIEALQVRKRTFRLAFVVLIATLLGGFLWLSSRFPDLYEERISGADNLYARVAQYQQSFALFLSHPLTGVGFNGFHNAAEKATKYVTEYNGVEALDYPHSNLTAVLAETGILGFIPYVVSQVLLVAAFRQVRRQGTPIAELVWKGFLCVFLSYWVSGLSLASGYYSDLNLWFVFAVTILYRFASCQPANTLQVGTSPG